ncbi:MAG: 23S rRNA (adenine(1618)-N(6))-methyltransferase RlmF [Bacteroidetes bacterium HGW-Bacteroidetes-15]|nr:MAG: 23S rRNA (adenine(1618)-N(6))-methyltransferase RlmF [Bacteroidetes bacterium HGW-Bacteroidetes-15]
MLRQKKVHPKEKSGLHPRNKHRERYNFKLLIASCPELAEFVALNNYDDESIDFFNPEAVKMLNKALLKHYYGIENWDIPKNYLCPPVPGRADYIHHVADLLSRSIINNKKGEIPTGSYINCLDIGVGANCIYPIIGNKEYGWSFIGSDIDPIAIESSSKIVETNPPLKKMIELRLQTNKDDVFRGIIHDNELFDLTICNPPFHTSFAESQSVAVRKLQNLKHKKINKPILNFGGQNTELWCEGGEEKFVENMIFQSKQFATSCFWFTTLISKQTNLKNAYKALKGVDAVKVETIPMSQGNKISRIVAWTFLDKEQQERWINTRWK